VRPGRSDGVGAAWAPRAGGRSVVAIAALPSQRGRINERMIKNVISLD
jgi:hypothetical protein